MLIHPIRLQSRARWVERGSSPPDDEDEEEEVEAAAATPPLPRRSYETLTDRSTHGPARLCIERRRLLGVTRLDLQFGRFPAGERLCPMLAASFAQGARDSLLVSRKRAKTRGKTAPCSFVAWATGGSPSIPSVASRHWLAQG
ncbi:unnamed protein product [Lampetra planeri]